MQFFKLLFEDWIGWMCCVRCTTKTCVTVYNDVNQTSIEYFGTFFRFVETKNGQQY